jgi:hypothetical protein
MSAWADNAARAGRPEAALLFWLALLVIYVPIAIRLLTSGAGERERSLLVLALYLSIYLVSFLQYPLAFTTHDAMGQIRTAEDIVRTGHLFSANPIVTAYASFPGLQLASASLAQVSGLSLFASGALLLGAARAILAISLFAAVKTLADARTAGVACLIYATNPSFLFFDAQYAYESLALPLAVLALAVLVKRRGHVVVRWGGGFALLLVCGLVATHFATTVWFLVLIISWVIVDSLPRTIRVAAPPRFIVLIASLVAVGWFWLVARTTVVEELGPVVSSAVSSVFDLAAGKSNSKQLFVPAAGPSDPAYLELLSFLSVGILVILVVVSAWRWRRMREPVKVVLLLLMLMYPVSLALRLTSAGTETSQRASEFVFIGIGLGVAGLSARRLRTSAAYRFAGVVIAVVLFVGEIVVGTAPYSRLPGPYLVGADSRSMDERTLTAATWVRTHLPVGSVFAADRSNALALAAIGLADPAQGLASGQSVPYLYFSSVFNARDIATIRAFGIRYVLVDLRLSTSVPYIGLYFSPDEQMAHAYTHPIPLADLTKFATAPGLTQIYNNGDIQIYRVDTKAGS